MSRWLGPSGEAPEPITVGQADRTIPSILRNENVTDDPLAAFDTHHRHRQIYSVSRSVYLPRVSLKSTANTQCCPSSGKGINPLFRDVGNNPETTKITRQTSPHPGEKSNSSGYGGSNGGSSLDPLYVDSSKALREDAVAVLEQNPNFVKSIKVAGKAASSSKTKRSVPSSSSSGGGTLTTIPEGRVDLPIPKPIWPREKPPHDSLVDDALLLYTSLNYVPDGKNLQDQLDVSVKEILIELLNSINETMDGRTGLTAEEMLKTVNERIALSIESLKLTTEEEMKKLCINLSNCRKINSVLRAFNSSGSPEWSSSGGRVRTLSSDTDDTYHTPSGSSSSGFSDLHHHALPVFIHEDLASVPNGVRNVMIYGTLCRAKASASNNSVNDKFVHNNKENLLASTPPKKNSLRAINDNKPSVWEQYYGVRATAQEAGEVKYVPKPTDVPLFPGGRPEADFTLDVPRSELLSKRMKQDKKWRCRCRLLTSFLGLIFFLLSVMAVSLMLTRGKRMFGSMM